MKQLICKLLLVVLIVPVISFGQASPDSQIKRVEQGLLPLYS